MQSMIKVESGEFMASEREMKEKQEEMLFDNCFSQELLKKGKADKLGVYLKTTNHRLKSGMADNEIELVEERARKAAAEFE